LVWGRVWKDKNRGGRGVLNIGIHLALLHELDRLAQLGAHLGQLLLHLFNLGVGGELLRRRDLLGLLVLLFGGAHAVLEGLDLVALVLDGLLQAVQQVVVLHHGVERRLAPLRDVLAERQEAVLNLPPEVQVEDVRGLVAGDGVREEPVAVAGAVRALELGGCEVGAFVDCDLELVVHAIGVDCCGGN
jgi:hypothetical protein